MSTELTDLLPEERRAQLRQAYFFRLGTVVVMLTACLVVSAAVLLIPTFVFLTNAVEAKTTRLAGMNAGLSSTEEASLAAKLTTLSNDDAALGALGATPSATKIMSQVLSVSRPGIRLSALAYTPRAGKTAGIVTLDGIALTRDALRSYQLALQGAPFAASADLPVSAYAKDSDIDFTITITLAP